MDVLRGSIDVRDLLAAGELDPAAPLSAPDLRLLVDRLQSRSLHIKDRVRSCLRPNLPAFSAAFSACSRTYADWEKVAADVDSLLGLVSAGGDAEIRGLVAEIGSKRRELAERKEALRCVQAVADLEGRMRSAEEDLVSGRLVEAAEVVRDLRTAVGGEDDGTVATDSQSPEVLWLLRKEWRKCYDEVHEALARMMEKAVLFDVGSGEVVVRIKYNVSAGGVGEVKLQTVLTAMERAGVLDYGLAKLADLMIKHVMIPTISEGFAVVLVEGLEQGIEQKSGPILRLSSNCESEGVKSRVGTTYSTLVQILRFIYQFLLFRNDFWMQHFGRLTWLRIAELVTSHILSKFFMIIHWGIEIKAL